MLRFSTNIQNRNCNIRIHWYITPFRVCNELEWDDSSHLQKNIVNNKKKKNNFIFQIPIKKYNEAQITHRRRGSVPIKTFRASVIIVIVGSCKGSEVIAKPLGRRLRKEIKIEVVNKMKFFNLLAVKLNL